MIDQQQRVIIRGETDLAGRHCLMLMSLSLIGGGCKASIPTNGFSWRRPSKGHWVLWPEFISPP